MIIMKMIGVVQGGKSFHNQMTKNDLQKEGWQSTASSLLGIDMDFIPLGYEHIQIKFIVACSFYYYILKSFRF